MSIHHDVMFPAHGMSPAYRSKSLLPQGGVLKFEEINRRVLDLIYNNRLSTLMSSNNKYMISSAAIKNSHC